MASTEVSSSRPHDRHGRRRPFANWMKRLANLKSPSASAPSSSSNKHNGSTSTSKGKKGANYKNNPYPLSADINKLGNVHLSFSEPAASERPSHLSRSEPSFSESGFEQHAPTTGTRSAAPTLSTNADTTISDAAHSKAGTTATNGGVVGSQGGGEGSTFSSPSPSVRSLTTTLTTVQSAALSNQVHGGNNNYSLGGGGHHAHSTTHQTGLQFSHQFPTSPATAVPSHLAPQPTTYNSATANNLLTDNASVLTLASSSKRRRRNSLDTNASVRALAPSSIFSGSRESLPLSVLSGNVGNTGVGGEPSNSSITNAPGVLNRPGLANTERASVYSTGTATGDRSSYQPNRPQLGDTSSVRSGFNSHHGRNDSTTGSIAVPGAPGRVSRRGSGWGEVPSANDSEDEAQPAATYETNGNSGKGKGKANQ
ncbi:hypothetical protein FQN55_006004 [Onygenales sp. PD_40]|nr:hypothetical protein FQN55_006004 [Onygenales sp. PD_40]KAK2795376.1 hypothetical protein FQN51_000466 [Onygenales sp. PD_10]